MGASAPATTSEPQQRTLYKLCIVEGNEIRSPSDEELRVTLGAPLLIESEPELLPVKQGSIMDLVAKMVEEQGAAFCQHCGVRCAHGRRQQQAAGGPGASAARGRWASNRGVNEL